MEDRKTNLLGSIDRAQSSISMARLKIDQLGDQECSEALVAAQSRLDQARAAIEHDMDMDVAEEEIDNTIQEMIAVLRRLSDLQDEVAPEGD